MNDLYENTNYTNNNDKIDINKINIQYYDFLKNLVDKNNFEQQQDINNFSNLLNNTNNTNDNINNDKAYVSHPYPQRTGYLQMKFDY